MKQEYFICINGINEFESSSINELKNIARHISKGGKIKDHKGKVIGKDDIYEMYIGMYNIDYIDEWR